jgi:hypothetical protein
MNYQNLSMDDDQERLHWHWDDCLIVQSTRHPGSSSDPFLVVPAPSLGMGLHLHRQPKMTKRGNVALGEVDFATTPL